MSDTPRTDAEVFSDPERWPRHYVDADFARRLERELNDALREKDVLLAAIFGANPPPE